MLAEIRDRSTQFYAAMSEADAHGNVVEPALRSLLGDTPVHAWFMVTDYRIDHSGMTQELDVVLATPYGVAAFGSAFVPDDDEDDQGEALGALLDGALSGQTPGEINTSFRLLPWSAVADVRVLTAVPTTASERTPNWARLVLATGRNREMLGHSQVEADADGGPVTVTRLELQADFIGMTASAGAAGPESVEQVITFARTATALLHLYG